MISITDYTFSTALGLGKAANYQALLTQKHGLRRCDFEKYQLPFYIGRITALEQTNVPPALSAYDCRNNQLATLALQQDNFDQAVGKAIKAYGAHRVAVIMGTTTSGLLQAEHAYQSRDRQSEKFTMDFNYDATANPYSLSEFVREYFAIKGPTLGIGTACSSSARVMLHAKRMLAANLCDAVIAGGVDTLCGSTLCGFNSLQLLSPTPAMPCDAARQGLSLGEGAGFLLLQRDADVKTDLTIHGIGESCDAWHISTPDPDGTGAKLAMQQALDKSGLTADAIDYVNMHGTASPANDSVEANAIEAVLGAVPCASTKGATGHTLGAAGAVEISICCLSLQHQQLFGCTNTQQVAPEINANVILNNQQQTVNYTMNNSFGFGGNNCSVIIGRKA